MATVNKDFKIKSGLIVEGTTATVNGYDVLTKKQADQDYVVNLIGGTATSANTPSTVVKRDANGDFAAGTITADLTGQVSDISNHDTDDLGEGTTNKYFTNQRALDATAAAYDAAGLAAQEAGYVASDLSDHMSDTSAHGVSGAVVGTTDAQTLTNKTIGDTLNFTGAGAMTINSDSHIVLTPASGSSVKWGSDVLATENYVDAAETAANGYTDGEITTALSTAQGYATTAQGNAETYADGVAGAVQDNLDDHTGATSAHGVTGNIVGTTDTQTISNKTLGSDLAAGGYKVSGLADPTADQDSATKAYVDDAIANLVDSAPAALDTLNELAAALGDDVDLVTGLATSIGNKVAKAGDSMTGDLDFGGTHKVTSLATPTNSADAATKGYVDGEITSVDGAAQGYASAADTSARGYADSLATNYDASGDAAQALLDANSYTDTGLGYKQDSLTVGDGLDLTGATLNVVAGEMINKVVNPVSGNSYGIVGNATYLDVTNPTGYNSEIDVDITALESKLTTDGFASQTDISDAIDALSTSDIEEGSNSYFTDARAKSSAADLLTGASLTNITITGTGSGLTITAENGVADSTTDDLDEGATNLYFTDVRAVAAIQAVTPIFTEVDLNSVARQVAATLEVPTAGIQTAYAWQKSAYRSAEFLVKVAYGIHTEISKVLLTLDTSDNIAITEYGIVGTNGSVSSISASVNEFGGCFLNVTTANNNSTVTVMGTLLV